MMSTLEALPCRNISGFVFLTLHPDTTVAFPPFPRGCVDTMNDDAIDLGMKHATHCGYSIIPYYLGSDLAFYSEGTRHCEVLNVLFNGQL